MKAAPEGQPPDHSVVQQAARALADNGFTVLRAGRYGVSVEAPADLFARVLGVTLTAGAATVARARPAVPSLTGLVDLVEVTPRPERFSP